MLPTWQTYLQTESPMRPNEKMSDAELQAAAREALEGHTQSAAAEALGVHRSTISLALNNERPSRYAGTLKRIIEHYTDYHIETETTTVHRPRKKG